MSKDVSYIVSKHNALFTEPPRNTPSKLVADGPIIGNGDIGVVMGGSPDAPEFWISKCDFWKSKNWYPNGGVRALGRIDLNIRELQGAPFHVTQSLYDACLKADFRIGAAVVEIRAWTPANENMLFIEIQNRGCDIHAGLEILAMEGDEAETASGRCDGDMDISWVSRKYVLSGLVWPVEGIIAVRREGMKSGDVVIKKGESVVIAAYICTSFDAEDCLGHACGRLSGMPQEGISEKRRLHEAWWADYWKKSVIEIDDKLIEKFWYGSHYIMACCSRNDRFPPGLFGNWITTDEPEWAGDYHLNYNYQAPWWGVYSSNRVEIARPYDAPLLQYMEAAQENAKRLLGCRGVYYDVGIGPMGYNSSRLKDDLQFWGQKSNAAYAAINMLMRFYHTYDLDYVRSGPYRFLFQAALFWEDYLKYEEGRYVIYNDAIHETSDLNAANKNPILTLGLLRALFKGVIDISTELGLDEDKRPKWRHILDNLSDFPVQVRNGRTVYRYTEIGPDWWRDNTLGIQHIWPCGAVGLDSPPELLELARNTVEELDRWTDFNGFPTFFTAAARVGYDPEVILEKLHIQCEEHSYPNLFIFFGGGGIECCSGVPSCINEMLLQSHEGVIRLFPVWPAGREAGFETLRAEGAFLVSAGYRDGKAHSVLIQSEKGRRCTVENPWREGEVAVNELCKGTKQSVPCDLAGRRISFDTKAGGVYSIDQID